MRIEGTSGVAALLPLPYRLVPLLATAAMGTLLAYYYYYYCCLMTHNAFCEMEPKLKDKRCLICKT